MCFCDYDMQVRMNKNLTKNHQETGKTSTRLEDGQIVNVWDPRISFSPSCSQIWQEKSLEYYFGDWQNLPLKFGKLHF